MEGERSSFGKLYDTAAWRLARKQWLQAFSTCCRCPMPATVVDHVVPHRGDLTIFWDRSNWQPMCWRCHSRKTVFEDGGFGRARKAGT